jgi:hypothetical protein
MARHESYDAPVPEDKELFTRLASRWMDETVLESSVRNMTSHPDHMRIVGMGQRAVPLLLQAITSTPYHWDIALASITGKNPVPQDERGDMAKVSKAWLDWGRSNGYIA